MTRSERYLNKARTARQKANELQQELELFEQSDEYLEAQLFEQALELEDLAPQEEEIIKRKIRSLLWKRDQLQSQMDNYNKSAIQNMILGRRLSQVE